MKTARKAVWRILMVAVIGLWASQMQLNASDLHTNDYSLRPTDWYDFFTCPLTPGQNGLGDCCGMPVWGATEPYCNLWVKDMPLGYQPARGPAVALQLAYKMRDDGAGYSANEFSFGKGWNCDWRSFVQIGSDGTNVFLPGGGVVPFTNTVEFHSYSILTNPAANVFWLLQRDGSTNIYSFAATVDGTNRIYLTGISDAFGQKLTLQYATNSTVARLLCLIDADGRTNSLTYTNAGSNTNLVVAVTDGYGRTARIGYNSSWQLTGIADVVTNASSFAYDTTGWMTNLATPYGTNTFTAQQGTNWGNPTNGFYRWLHVQDAGGGNHLWVYRSDLRDVLGTNDLYRSANSFYWGPRQYDVLPNKTNLQALSANDYVCARRKNWDRTRDLDRLPDPVGLMFQWEFSPDGVNPGQRTDYEYADDYNAGQAQPLWVARTDLATGYWTWWDYTERNAWGAVVMEEKPFESRPWGELALYWPHQYFWYSGDGIDLNYVEDFYENYIAIIGYTNHLPVAITNANYEVTQFSYNEYGQMVGVADPGGVLTTTNAYFTSGPSLGRLQSTTDYTNGVAVRQDSFTYIDDHVFTHTDTRGNVTTNYWDALGRLTGQSDGLGASTNIYDRLDLVLTKDRMGYTNGFVFDPMRRLTDHFDALGRHTHIEHCTCGAVNSVTEAVGTPRERAVNFTYDNAGRQLRTDFPSGLWVTNNLNLLGQVISTTDSAGRSVSYAYNIQGLAYAVSNALGQINYAEFDYYDRITLSTDADGVTYNRNYDNLGRPYLIQSEDGSWFVQYGYSQNIAGPTSITDALSHQTHIGYDPFGRKIAETNANYEVTHYSYEPDGALKSLMDGNGHTRTWNYNIFGLLTNKLDGLGHEVLRLSYNVNGWVTNRWTPEKLNTGYGFDNVGNLKTIIYPEQTVQFAIDELNRMTNMVDASGTNAFTWSPNDELVSETGTWLYSAVTNGYTQGRRTALGIGTNWVQSYEYADLWRMSKITSPAGQFRYNYGVQPASALVTGIRLPNSAFVTNQFDSLARLNNTALVNFWGHTLDGYGYTLNALGQRTGILRDVGLTNSIVSVDYDDIGQVTSWSAKEANGSVYRAQEQLSFAFDASHNLTNRISGALVQSFSTDAADQINSVARSGSFTLPGATPAPATSVTVNGQTAARYGDLTFAATNLTLLDGANSFTNIAQNVYGAKATNILAVNYPETVSLGWDQNGSLTNDGLRTFCFDSANRLTNVFVPGQWRCDFLYDGLNRRRIAREFAWQSGAWVQKNETRLIYDGMLLVQERDTNNVPLVTYTRGLDLSGSISGAGGIGGLLARTDSAGSLFYHADGNGNITALMDSQENIVGRYLYAPYGKLLGKWGSQSDANVMRFSSKPAYRDDLYDFGERWLTTTIPSWLTVDPIGEEGGANLRGFVGNDPVDEIDPFGLTGYMYVRDAHGKVFQTTIPDSPEDAAAKQSAEHRAVVKEFWQNGGSDAAMMAVPGPQDIILGEVFAKFGLAARAALKAKRVEAEAAQLAKKELAKECKIAGQKSAEAAKKEVQFTKSSLKLGQEMHKAYKAGLADGVKRFKEFRLPSGRRIDFLDVEKGIIYELKPNNPRAIREGTKQLQIYLQELRSIPQFQGINWRTVLDTY